MNHGNIFVLFKYIQYVSGFPCYGLVVILKESTQAGINSTLQQTQLILQRMAIPDLEVRSCRRVHNVALYHSTRHPIQIGIHPCLQLILAFKVNFIHG
jgi:hypothetical protein